MLTLFTSLPVSKNTMTDFPLIGSTRSNGQKEYKFMYNECFYFSPMLEFIMTSMMHQDCLQWTLYLEFQWQLHGPMLFTIINTAQQIPHRNTDIKYYSWIICSLILIPVMFSAFKA